jgi:class 3 adenylate cyclase
MAPTLMQRKLTVILSADVVGYSGLIEADEMGTLERLKANRSLHVATHGGRVFKLMGDGALVEFSSVVAAVVRWRYRRRRLRPNKNFPKPSASATASASILAMSSWTVMTAPPCAARLMLTKWKNPANYPSAFCRSPT